MATTRSVSGASFALRLLLTLGLRSCFLLLTSARAMSSFCSKFPHCIAQFRVPDLWYVSRYASAPFACSGSNFVSVKAFCTLEFVAWHICLCYSDSFWHHLSVIYYIRVICYFRVFCSLYAVGCACSPTEPLPTTHFCSGPSRCIFRLVACVWVARVSLFYILLQHFLLF